MHSILLVIDMQKAMDHPKFASRNNENAEDNISKLLDYWRTRDWPVIFIQDCSPDPNSPFHPSQPTHAFKDGLEPLGSEIVVQKTGKNGFEGTNLSKHITDTGLTKLTITGCHTPYCVRATVEAALYRDLSTTIVCDATVATDSGSFDERLNAEDIHLMVLDELKAISSEVCSTDDLL